MILKTLEELAVWYKGPADTKPELRALSSVLNLTQKWAFRREACQALSHYLITFANEVTRPYSDRSL